MVFTRDNMMAGQNFNKGSSFSRGEEEFLMDRWEENPVLWDIHHPEFKNYSLKDATKENIASQMNRSVGDIKMKMKYLNDQYTRARRKILTSPETTTLSRRDEHLLRRLSFLQESKTSSCPGFITEVKDSQDAEGQETTIVISSVNPEDQSLTDPYDTSESEDSVAITMQDPKDASGKADSDNLSPGESERFVSENPTDHDIKDVIINLHQTTATVATVSSTSTTSKPSPVRLTAVGANKRTRSPQALILPGNNNTALALPPATSFGGETKNKKRKASEHEILAGAAHNVVTNNSMTEDRKSEAYYFGQFVTEALKTMSPDARYWCQMEISRTIYQARSRGLKKLTSTDSFQES